MSFIPTNTQSSLACLPHYTSGQTYFYPAFNAGRTEDAIKFAHEFGEVLAMPIMLEAVQRVRASRGQLQFTFILHLLHNQIVYQVYEWLLSMETSLLGLRISSRCPPSHKTSLTQLRFKSKTTSQHRLLSSRLPSFTQLATVSGPVNFSNVLLYSFGGSGERRIRVINLALPTTSNLSEVYASADQVAIATLLANKAVERSITHSLENSREAVFSKLVEILTAYKASMTAAGAGASAQLAISENMKMLPVLVLGLLKNVSDN